MKVFLTLAITVLACPPAFAASEIQLSEAHAVGLVYEIQQMYRARIPTCDIDKFNTELAEKKAIAYMINDKRLFDESLREGALVFQMGVRGGPTAVECDDILVQATKFGLEAKPKKAQKK
jgi:hypothetical protein